MNLENINIYSVRSFAILIRWPDYFNTRPNDVRLLLGNIDLCDLFKHKLNLVGKERKATRPNRLDWCLSFL